MENALRDIHQNEVSASGCADGGSILISVVIPAFNESESLESLHAECVAACERCISETPSNFEIIVVDDGSTDETPEVCAGLSPLRYVRLDKNLGQSAALDRGFAVAQGTYVAALDADGQNDPADIPALLAYLEASGLDCVCGWRVHRHDPLGKRIASRGAYVLRQLLVRDGIHDSGCTLKVFRRECLERLRLADGQHRFIPALLKSKGFSVGEVPVNHRPRLHGTSKYGPSRMRDGLRDLIALRASIRKTRA